MNILHSTLSSWRDKLAPITHTSTFRNTGQITPEEFVLAGDYLVYKFPTWSWADAATPNKRVAYLPEGKQYLVTRGVPCHRRLDENFAGPAGQDEAVVRDGFAAGEGGEGDDGWLRTGGLAASEEAARVREVRTVDESGNVVGDEKEVDEEEEIPDMEDEEDDEEAIIRDPKGGSGTTAPLRTYTLYITYTPYYRTPRLYLSGYVSPSEPLQPHLMMEDIVGDYKDKTVTLEDFPFFDTSVKMASVHPCRHASVMKVLLDRADAALKIRLSRKRQQQLQQQRQGTATSHTGEPNKVETGFEGLVEDTKRLNLGSTNTTDLRDDTDHAKPIKAFTSGVAAAGGSSGDEWEVLQHESGTGSSGDDADVAIRVDQYLVVFLKFLGSVMPAIEHDFTMGV